MYEHAKPTQHRLPIIVLAALLVLSLATACAMPTAPTPTRGPDLPSPTPEVAPTVEGTPVPTPTPTPVPPKHLTICQAEEPSSLFFYDAYSQAARNVLAAIYDGPIGVRDYRLEPVILERLPSLENGDAVVRPVQVGQGEAVLNMAGEVVELAPGVRLRNVVGEPVTFQGGTITTTQTVVTFTLREDVVWADGEPLTTADSRYSYEVAGSLQDAGLDRQLSLTASYEAVDERTIVWTGVPGYRDTAYMLNFFHPLPRHAIGEMDMDALRQSDVTRQRPLGWGPFVIEEWVEGEHIKMVPNPHYFRAPEGLPHLDSVTFRFITDSGIANDQLLTGDCDILTPDLTSGIPPQRLLDAIDAGLVQLVSSIANEWEHLDFGIKPAAWAGRVPFFASVQVRQAVAHCVDRERIAGAAFPIGEAVVAHSYVPSQHLVYGDDQLRRWPYDPAEGRAMLEAAGWRDTDGDGIREAHGIPEIAGGTPFSVTLLTTDNDPARERTAEILKENLANCGIGMGVRYLPAEVFYADGPDGPVFGRQFDLALFSWLNGLDAPCEIYLSTEIPDEDNWWATFNNPGYESAEYDQACRAGLEALYGTEAHLRRHHEAQAIFSRDVPVLPLYFVPESLAARPEVRGVIVDPSQDTPFRNIGGFDLEW